MVKSIIQEFVKESVMTQEHADSLWNIITNSQTVEHSKNYVETFCFVVLTMLKHKTYIPQESTPIRQALRDLFNQNPSEFERLVKGDQKLVGFFIGRTMKISQKFNPKDVQKRLSEMIEEEKQTYIWEESWDSISQRIAD